MTELFSNTKKKPVTTVYRVKAPVSVPHRLALAADLHNDCWETLYEALIESAPDAVLAAGDFIEDAGEGGKRGLAFLRAAAEKWHVFFTPGNHEAKFPELGAVSAAAETGVVLLDNGFTRFGELVIGGIHPYERDSGETLDFLDRFSREDGCRILISHRPEWFPFLRDYPIPVIVSGHAHGGQMRPFGIALYAPGQGIFPKYSSGVYEDRLIVSRGLSNHVRLPRLWNPPELVVIELVPDTARDT